MGRPQDKFKLSPLEVAEQKRVIAVYRAKGWKVYVHSQGRITRQTPGYPDLTIFTQTGLFFHETKAQRGKLSAAQLEFQSRCVAARIVYLVGGEKEAQRHADRENK